jgi:hypothetical protein
MIGYNVSLIRLVRYSFVKDLLFAIASHISTASLNSLGKKNNQNHMYQSIPYYVWTLSQETPAYKSYWHSS